MGLDISYFSKIEFVRALGESDYADWPRERALFNVNRLRCDGFEAGAYTAVEAGDFRAGSYSGYNEWRELLAKLTGKTARGIWIEEQKSCASDTHQTPNRGPFVELINFSDCEGTIGPRTCAKLAKDFQDWRERAEKFAQSLGGENGQYFMRKYSAWQEAFETAANEGCVDLH